MRCGAFLAVVVVAACSGGDAELPAVAPSGVTTIAADATNEGPPGSQPVDGVSVTSDVPAAADPTATVEIVLESESATLSGDVAGSSDPFGDFVSCSGLRESFTTYSVLVSATVGEVRSVSAVTNGVVVAEGIHDAVVRVEFANGSAVDATGTITLLPGFQTGSFIAFDAAGTPVEGSFACIGSPGAGPIDIGTDDGVLDQIDVFALLRRGDASRLVGFAVSSDSAATIACAGATGVETDRVVAVDGDDSIGAITAFTLDAGSEPMVSMRVGDVTYAFTGVRLSGTNTGTAGSFSAEADGLTVDGAYRCS